MRFLNGNIRTKLTALFILVAAFYTQFSMQLWETEDTIIRSDVQGYYAYLPALFIHDDIQLEHPEKFTVEPWYIEDANGTRHIKFTCGMAIIYSPFFFVAHAIAENSSYAADGYSYPYRYALAMSSLLFLALGVIYMSRLLLRFFSDRVSAITLLIIFAGTNAFQYFTINMTMSHGYSLTLITMFLYFAIRWNDMPNLRWAIGIGLTSGLFTLIRPIDILFVLIIPLMGVVSRETLYARIRVLITNWRHIIVMLICAFIVVLPQLIYFKMISGEFLFFSYTGESFYFSSPHIFDSLFSYRNGWLVYSPLMIFSIIGFYYLNKSKQFKFLIPILSVIYLYVISSWWCWWYPGYGNRAFINMYPILSFPLAYLTQFILDKKWVIRIGFKLIIFCGVVLSGFQTYQYSISLIHWGAMTKESYWDAFLQPYPSQLFETYLRYPVTEKQKAGRNIIWEPKVHYHFYAKHDFDAALKVDSSFTSYLQFNQSRSGSGALRLKDGTVYAGNIIVKTDSIDAVYITAWAKNPPRGLQIVLGTKDSPNLITSESANKFDGEWEQIRLYTKIPEGFKHDSLSLRIWNPWREFTIIDDLIIRGINYSYHEKEVR